MKKRTKQQDKKVKSDAVNFAFLHKHIGLLLGLGILFGYLLLQDHGEVVTTSEIHLAIDSLGPEFALLGGNNKKRLAKLTNADGQVVVVMVPSPGPVVRDVIRLRMTHFEDGEDNYVYVPD